MNSPLIAAAIAVLLATTTSTASAQTGQPAPGQSPHGQHDSTATPAQSPAATSGHGQHGQSPAAPAPTESSGATSAHGQHGASPGGAAASGQEAHSHMMGSGMMCPMMTSHGSGGHGTTASSDPKAEARMLRMRGEMMKAMGEVMLKHAEALEQGK